jgi:hypothetical protein
MKPVRLYFALLLALGIGVPVLATETAFWQMGSFEEFLQGTMRDVSLSKEGELTLAPEARTVFSPEETLVLALTADPKGNIYLGTGHQGNVFRVESAQKGSVFFTAEEPDIFALATAPDGTLFVGSSPEGKIYRVTPDGKSSVLFDPKAKYIWALTLDPKGNLYAATGDQGRIYKIDPSGKGEVFFDSKQTHLMCLTLDRDGNLLAGSVPKGLIYRITPQGKGFVLYQASLPEIHDIVTDARGRIYAAALGGTGGAGTPTLFGPPTVGTPPATPVATVTVTAGTEDATHAPATMQTPPNQQPQPSSFNRATPVSTPFAVPRIPQGQGSLIQILPDNTVETLWSSKEESIFGLALRGDEVLFSTDANGRIFVLSSSRENQKLTLLTQTREALATRLLLQGTELYVATSNLAKLFRVGRAPGREGTYESPVKDTKFVSRWGVMAWRADIPAGAKLEFYSRSGNSERPDATWSDWTGPYTNPDGSPIGSPPARYLQWKGVFGLSGQGAPVLHEVTVAYLNQNLPPQIRSFNVSTSGERTGPTGSPTSANVPSGAATITVTGGSASTFPSSPAPSRGVGKAPTTLSWQAEDPNGDSLTYAIYLQASDEESWRLLKDKLRQTSFTIDPSALPDGKYLARLVASDAESNPPATARTAELVSAPFWIDNTPPQVRVLRQQSSATGEATVQFQVEDQTSPLKAAEISIDAQDFVETVSDDGIVDARMETFTVHTAQLDPGEHLVTLRVYDTAGNAGLGKAVIRLADGKAKKP